jgi:prepilin-type N-terminal cleavage/methylation domain-containing protein
MSRRRGFTLIELLVVIAIIALLMSILMPALARVRRQAKDVICQSNEKQWAIIFSMFTNDHNGYFPKGFAHGGGESWFAALRPYYGEEENSRSLRTAEKCCPEATKPDERSTNSLPGSTFYAWGGYKNWAFIDGKKGDFGSYGSNAYIYNDVGEGADWSEAHWRRDDVKNAGEIPMFSDMSWVTAVPLVTNTPPLWEDARQWSGGTGGNMGLVCLPRHNRAINMAFVDRSVRRVELKELWLLRWHRNYDLAWIRQNEPDWEGTGTGWMAPLPDADYIRP